MIILLCIAISLLSGLIGGITGGIFYALMKPGKVDY